MRSVRERLLLLRDAEYRLFQSRLMPTVDPDTVIGVRMPALRKLAKELTAEEKEAFLSALPHTFYEENNLHGILISACKDAAQSIELLDRFLPYVDNWATCDLIRPVSFQQHPEILLAAIRRWMESDRPYTVRFGIEMLMMYYLDDAFDAVYAERVASVRSEHYYVRMMVAWYFAEALAKRYDDAIPYIREGRLSPWIHNMTIRKAVESYRISDETKRYLKTLRRKTASKVGN